MLIVCFDGWNGYRFLFIRRSHLKASQQERFNLRSVCDPSISHPDGIDITRVSVRHALYRHRIFRETITKHPCSDGIAYLSCTDFLYFLHLLRLRPVPYVLDMVLDEIPSKPSSVPGSNTIAFHLGTCSFLHFFPS